MKHLKRYSGFLLESTEPDHTKPARYFRDDSWKSALDSAAGDLASIKKILDKLAKDLSGKYPKIKWEVVATSDAYTGVCFGYDLTMKLPGWLSKRFISMDVCFKSKKAHDFDNSMLVDMKDKTYTLDIYYYKEIKAYGEKQLNNNPTISESSEKPYTLKQVQSAIGNMESELSLLKDTSLKEAAKTADTDKCKKMTDSGSSHAIHKCMENIQRFDGFIKNGRINESSEAFVDLIEALENARDIAERAFHYNPDLVTGAEGNDVSTLLQQIWNGFATGSRHDDSLQDEIFKLKGYRTRQK